MDDIVLSVFGAEYVIKTVHDGSDTWYCAKDVENTLNLKKIRNTLSKMPKDMKRTFKSPSPGGHQNMLFVSEAGFMDFISRTRSIHSVEVAKQLGMNVQNHVPMCDERDILLQIAKAFNGEIMHTQYTVLTYKIDLYFPKFNLALEFDEAFHKQQLESDKCRESAIYNEIGCTFIRFSMKDDIFGVINRIFRHIQAKSTHPVEHS